MLSSRTLTISRRFPSPSICRRGRALFSNNVAPLSARERFALAQPPYGSVGVAKAVESHSQDTASEIEPTLFKVEFSLADRVAFVTGGNRGIGLESALTLLEGGARVVYCLDLPKEPGEEWSKVREYVARMRGGGRLEYVSGDVRDQETLWKVCESIGDREGRMDVCVAAAGIFAGSTPSLEYPEQQFQHVVDVNLKGVLFAAQASGRQMVRFNTGGSIICVASICGSVALDALFPAVSYHSTKSAVLQMARSMACELGPKGIRVNTLSPGFIKTKMIEAFEQDEVMHEGCASLNPLGRLGRPDELRGAIAWLASNASSFCTGSDIIVSGGHTAW